MLNILEDLLHNNESEVVEFKEAKNQFDTDKLGKYFSALSNEANLQNKKSAYVVLGIADNKAIVGTTISDKVIDNYKKEIADHSSIGLSFSEVYRIEKEHKNILILEIPSAPKGIPIAWKGHYYARNGSNLTALNVEKLERIRSQIRSDWSAEIIPDATIDDLCPDAIAFARKQYKEKNSHLKDEIDSWDSITFLNKAKVCKKGKITRTAIILLGKPESTHFITPSNLTISWILKDRDNIEKDYQHFTCPFITQVNNVRNKIRNLTYRYINDDGLFPDEVKQFDTWLIREALHNCIAHQDYSMAGKIIVVENESGTLTFRNAGNFIPQSIEDVIEQDAPQEYYRNPFLVNAMVELNMIDTIGSGIKKMFIIQKNKYFPLPEYEFDNQKVTLKIIGKVVNLDYAKKLALLPELILSDIILLDRVAKGKEINQEQATILRNKKLIEGRRPNYIISSKVAVATKEKVKYIKNKGFNDEYYMEMILQYLRKFNVVTRKDIDDLLIDKLPEILTDSQKKHKVKNLLQRLKSKHNIKLNNKREWILN
ncbi:MULTISPECIES: RNA-binding domain-containing protein [Pasteurellaceae]|uniref:DNA binding domain-containing protein n=1 Tax=Pasteurella atlantica TaxID=2827233 RepID=A0AAW8CSC8_9PAST|nr:RNA-binding domain-containing protein [Pasteurella atlantica]MBR0574383.1 putative DNA binding domain-containing protein [Pasteurella atlantica]MDP8040287.1 putative DNA binding domain-containing protein [Pasteurella atlantica]MDP8042457.1 putative DNA binding domain-containing protein [Pasteurella atlantica]MDP8044306.1 putative DNA binding domain-containing protein [Pasteurella atlantica]MDP8046605.1 putative DNA binding domain-containing protein [Pasteurella atlantica]